MADKVETDLKTVSNEIDYENLFMKNILITGGAGFIGSHVVRLFVDKYPNYQIFNLETLTYAGNLENIIDIESKPNQVYDNYFLPLIDIPD